MNNIWKKIFLNWEEITTKVKSISQNLDEKLSGGYKLSFFIEYLNWASYKTWDWDKLEIIEEKQEKKPKFKVWDYVVRENTNNWVSYIKIFEIWEIDWEVRYNPTIDCSNWFTEKRLRKPTGEELKKYFR